MGEAIADEIAKDIREGRRSDVLATENDLAAEFKAARRSVRTALKIVENLGLISAAVRGQPRQILYHSQQSCVEKKTRIGVFSYMERRLQSSSYQTVFHRLRMGFDAAGYEYEFFVAPGLSETDYSPDRVGHYCRQFDADLWLVQHASDRILPKLLPLRKPIIAMGGHGELLQKCHAVGYRNAEILAHATHLIHRRGHRRWLCPMPDLEFCSTDVMVNAFNEHPYLSMGDVFVEYEERNRDSLVCCLNRSWARTDEKPTLLVTSNSNLITSLSWIASKGLKIPEDISLLNIGDDAVVFDVAPDLDHYSIGPEEFSRKVLLLVRDLLIDPAKAPEVHALIGKYVEGKSILKR